MRALKLIHHMNANAEQMSEALSQKIRASERCSELLRKVPANEHTNSSVEIYRDLTDWLATETDSSIEERYVALGLRRAQQGVPFSNLYWAVCIAQDTLWEYIEQECLLDEPVEFWGGVKLLRALTQFFERALYFVLVGYQKAGLSEVAGESAA